jgi:ribosomal protein S18 acetylase RimI-like enzyme
MNEGGRTTQVQLRSALPLLSAVHLREFSLDDYPAVVALWEQYPDELGIGRSDTREEIIKKTERDSDLFLVAEEEGKVIGTVIGGFDGRRGIIYHLAVDRAFRGRGLGRTLMNQVESRLAAKGCIRAYLLVKPTNLDVLEFYKSLGWEPMPVALLAKNLP